MSKTIREQRYTFELLITLAIMIDLFVKVLPIVPVSFMIVVYILIRCNNYERAFLLLICYSPIVGAVFNSMGIGGVGGWCIILGAVLVLYLTITGQKTINNIEIAIIPFAVLSFLCLISSLTTWGGDYSKTKLISTVTNGGVGIIAYLVFFNNYSQFDTRRVGISYILLSAVMIRLSLLTNGIPGPSDYMDFGFLRSQSTLEEIENASFAISYQYVGFLSVQGMGLYLMSSRLTVNMEKVITLLFALLVVLYAGSRQAIVTGVLIFAIWLFELRKGGQAKRWVIIVSGLAILYILVKDLFGIDGLLYSVGQEGYTEGGGRGPWLLRGVELFLNKPIWGVGFGRYSIFDVYGTYPHNMIIEILCEMGIIGFTIVISISLTSVFKNKKALGIVLFLFIAIFLRAMASGALNHNIDLFALLFCLPALKSNQ